MKKSILHKIGFIVDIVFLALAVGLFIWGLILNGNSQGIAFGDFIIDGNGVLWIGIYLFVMRGLSFFAESAINNTSEVLPWWKDSHVAGIIFGILALSPICAIASILSLTHALEDRSGESFETSPLLLLKLNKREKFIHKFVGFFKAIPGFLKNLCIKIGQFFKKLGVGLVKFFKNIGEMFVKGSWRTKTSYFVMGFGNFTNKQIARGCLFFLMEAVFIVYMIFVGASNLSELGSLGTVSVIEVPQKAMIPGIGVDYVLTPDYVDNSFNILLFGVLTMFFIVGFIVTWYMNIKQSYANDKIRETQAKLVTDKDDLHALVDQDFYKTLLALPLLGILIFTILPIFFMILVAFTNYDKNHMPPLNLFDWVGFDNFGQLFVWSNSGGASFSATFGEILVWTLIWAFFATFTNYFLGMMVAMLINKKGIKLKKLWRTVLVFSIAIPQFISLLYVAQMFSDGGIINGMLQSTFGFKLPFWTDMVWARVTVIIINIWIGIPYLMLITTGILMNIPADLYESSKIDGASPIQQYMKITLPYMLFVTGPYLLTSFTGNMNNFNVIFLLSGGGPKDIHMYGSAGKTDLLITWLYSLTVNDSNYKLASVIGILIFIVVSVLSLVVYNLIPSTKNEEDFA